MTPEAYEIRDAIVSRLESFWLFKAVRGSIVEQVEPAEQLPAAIVKLASEVLTPDGDANHGEPSFMHDLTFVIMIKVASGDKFSLEPTFRVLAGETVKRLLTDPEFLSLFEGVSRIEQTHRFPKDGETYYGEARIQIDAQFRSIWPPFIPDDYRKTVLLTRQLGSDPDAPGTETIIDFAPE